MTEETTTDGDTRDRFSCDSLEFDLAFLVILLGVCIPPTVAYVTGEWTWTLATVFYWLIFNITVMRYVVNGIISALIGLDGYQGVKGNYDKAGLGLYGAFVLGLVFITVSALISILVLFILG